MEITFLGTGAAEGVPAMFCNCEYCQNIRKLGLSEYRTRTQVLIDGELSVDFPPEAYVHSLRFGVDLSSLKYLLVTHSHMDHFYAHDFILRGYKYAVLDEDKLRIFGNEEVEKVFAECTAREMKPEVAARLEFTRIEPYQRLSFGGYTVLTVPAQHSKTEQALLFYIEKNGKGYLHLHDSGIFSDDAILFLKENRARANLVAFDCTFVDKSYGENARHMGIEDNMKIKRMLLNAGVAGEDTMYVVTHFSHNSNPTRARLKKIEEEYGVTAAYDGLKTEI